MNDIERARFKRATAQLPTVTIEVDPVSPTDRVAALRKVHELWASGKINSHYAAELSRKIAAP